MKNFLYKNWKTTSAGIALFLLTILYITNKINTEQYLTIFGILTAVGLFAAKDGDKTGVNLLNQNSVADLPPDPDPEVGLPKPRK